MAIQFLNTVAVDTNVLYVDTSSDRVGIGTTSPNAKLNVSGGNLTVDNTASVTLRLNATSTSNPTVIVQAEEQGAVSPPMGQLRWDRNPGGVGMQLNYYNGSILNALKLDGSNFIVINNGSERMRIDSSGDVGIGTTNPDRLLHLKSSLPAIRLEDSDVSGLYHEFFASTGGLFQFKADGGNVQASSGFLFQVDASNAMIINSSGNVGINTISPGQKLDVVGSIRSQFNSGDYSQIESNSSGGVIKALSSGSTTVLFRSYGDSYILNDLGIGVTSPNAKLDVNGGVRIANDTSAASASNVGTLKYYTSGNNSYVDMCMQTGATTYAWVNIVTNTW